MSAAAALLGRDLRLAYRRRGELATPVIFFVLVTTLFPLGLAGLIGQQTLFKGDFDDGSLEQMLLNPLPLEWIALLRVATHWLATGLPIVILSPLMALLMDYPSEAMGTLALSLLLGTATLSLLGAVGAALTVGLRQSGMLMPILVLPLAVPVLIFGAQAAGQGARAEDPVGALYLLAAMLVLGITLAPFAIAAAVRVSLES